MTDLFKFHRSNQRSDRMVAEKYSKDIKGKRFSKLIAIRPVTKEKRLLGKTVWLCACDCGNKKEIRASSLVSGNTKSCGCGQKEGVTKHGLHGTKIYHAWRAMFNRCYNQKNENYSRYGGRGIKVCDRWKEFKSFHEDMGYGHADNLQLDRIDNNGDYRPENCRWVTTQQNCFNRNGRGGTSQYKGVYWNRRASKWIAKIVKDGKYYHLGSFDEERLAATAYNEAAIKFHGQYANINNIPLPPLPEQESE